MSRIGFTKLRAWNGLNFNNNVDVIGYPCPSHVPVSQVKVSIKSADRSFMNLTLTQTIFLAVAVSTAATVGVVFGIKIIWWAWKKLTGQIRE